MINDEEVVDTSALYMAAEFATYEDFSKRMVLLPRDDDECIGAKVGSHEVVGVDQEDIESDDANGHDVVSDGTTENSGKENNTNEQEETSTDNSTVEEEVNEGEEESANVQADAADDNNNNVQLDTVQSEHRTNGCVDEGNQHSDHNMQVPIGYVLAEIRLRHTNNNCNSDNNDIPEDLDSIEFTDLLSYLREAQFPLSLVFAPPNDSFIDDDDTHSKDDSATSQTSDPLEVEEELSGDEHDNGSTEAETTHSLTSYVNKEDAAKYAKQAASAAKSKLSNWGFQAASRAADAAKMAKELRDERQRKHNIDKQQNGEIERSESGDDKILYIVNRIEKSDSGDNDDDHNIGTVDAVVSVECKEGTDSIMEPCFIFLQTSTGFEQLPNGNQDGNDSVNNTSVISARLSKEKSCPLGDNGYTFQWYRSNYSLEKDCNNREQLTWSLLQGANYAAYQPSVSDVGHSTKVTIKCGNEQQICHSPCLIRLEESFLETAKLSLLKGGENSVTFGNLRGVDDQSAYRIRVNVSSNDDSIHESSIFIDKVTDDLEDESYNNPISHFKIEAAPAKPKQFELICASYGRLRLQATNRKTRESLILALGIANYKGKLSSLAIDTALFPSYQNGDDIANAEDGCNDIPSYQDNSYSKLLEAKLAEMEHLLQSKDDQISKFQNELIATDAGKVEMRKDIETVQQSERQLKDELEKSRLETLEKANTIDELNKQQRETEIAHEKSQTSLKNEMKVIQATIDARDGKIEVLTNQTLELSQKSSVQSKQLLSIGSLTSDLVQTKEKYTTAEKVIAKMKQTESELQNDLKEAKGIVMNLNEKFTMAKDAVTKCESDCRKLKMERSCLKNKNEGLSKEMVRMNKDKSEAIEIDKLKAVIDGLKIDIESYKSDIEKLKSDITRSQEQLEIVDVEKRDALERLEATLQAHQQSISHQLSTSIEVTDDAADDRIAELESIVTSMTEYLNAKEMQIETLKQVNRQLINEAQSDT